MGRGDPLTCLEVTASKVRVRERRGARDKHGVGGGGERLVEVKNRKGQFRVMQ